MNHSKAFRRAGPFLLALLLLSACSGLFWRRHMVQDPSAFHIQLRLGTEWVYYRLPLWPSGDFTGPQDTLSVRVVDHRAAPSRIDLDQWGGEYYWYDRPMMEWIPEGGWKKITGRFLSAVPVGDVFKVVSDGEFPRFLGGEKGYWADSSVGLLDVFYPRPEGRVVVYSPTATVRPYEEPGAYSWIEAAADTLIRVPAGEFRCFEHVLTFASSAHYLQPRFTRAPDPRSPFDPRIRREFWAEGVGLIAWIDQGVGEYWALAEYRTR